MDAEQIKAIGQLIGLLNDSSLAKGIGDCLQVTARLAIKNLSELENRNSQSRDKVASEPVVAEPNCLSPADLDEDDLEFLKEEFRSIREVAEFLDKSKSWVRENLLDTKIVYSKPDEKNGYIRVATKSVMDWMTNGKTNQEARGIRSPADN